MPLVGEVTNVTETARTEQVEREMNRFINEEYTSSVIIKSQT